ncbi:amino acid adenylation domain-containing protein [Massilia forsythiae]|uniref:Amino acid adenylation domain-containing protein n=1 Tax=Massilia forsythiae TaxID=2728020 RepID=A0A7Z2ZTF2_9BURK|nr:non-ribosomal peptide synthetase [Massilia forsythiae]QJE01526.1 amino acid adenylation domain-containing protein [Massilia forsythiae]
MRTENLSDFIDWCIGQSIGFRLEDETLRVSAQPGVLTPDVLAAIRARKDELTAWLAGQQPAARSLSAARVEPVARGDGSHPLSYAQQRVWFIDRMEGGSAHYNMPGAFRIRGDFSETLAEQALASVIARHEVLRTVYQDSPDGPRQRVLEQADFTLACHDLRNHEPAAREAAVRAALAADVSRPFDLAADLMLRAAFLRTADDEGVLLLNMHHIAADGWSVGVLVKEFGTIYAALGGGSIPEAGALPVQYLDYAAWQRSGAHTEQVERQLAHWKHALDGCPKVHALPLDKPRTARQEFRALSHRTRVPAALATHLSALARRHDATLFMVLQSAFSALLSRWSGEQDIVLAVPVAGRTRSEFEPLIGFFVNTLVFRSILSGNPSYVELLRQARDYALDAYGNQDVPFELLVDELRPERDLSYNPVCQVKFLLQNHEVAPFELPGMAVETLSADEEFIRFDLDLTIGESPRGLFLNWTYKESLFLPATIERLAAAFGHMLQAIADAPATPVAELPLLDQAGRERWLRDARGADDVTGRDHTVAAQFEQAAAEWPARTAVVHGGRTLSYAQLNAKANRLAHYLAEQGVGAGQRVGIHVERSPELLVAMLGVLKAGAAYVPFEPKNTRDRLGAIIRDAGIEWVLVQPGMADRLPPGGVDLLMLDDGTGSGWLDGYPEGNPSADGLAPALHDSAYVIYTSGSTGTPKGVEIAHLGLMDYCAFASRRYYAGHLAGSRVVTSHGFDITVPSLYLPLLRGGTVELLDAGEELACLAARLADPDCAPALLRMTPMHVRGLLELLPAATPVRGRHVFVVGGEAFTPGLARELQRRCPHSQLFNHYGPTETVVGCAMYDISANLDAIDRVLPIGRAMDNTRLYVLNAALQPCPAGVAGELHIGGAGVAKGYLNQPALTAAKFIADPFNPGERLYKTGDLVRMLAGGDIVFIGRADDQVKLRGYRIELGEVRAALQRLPQVRDAAVLVDGEGERKRLLGYLVPAAPAVDEAAYVAAVQETLRQALPEYMVPSGFALLNHLPLTPNGKIDSRALPAITVAGQCGFEAPRDATEALLCDIWQRLLKVERVGVHDNFFALGGDSILSIQVVARANQAGLGITTRQLFAHQSVAALARHAGAARQAEAQEAVQGTQVLLPIQRQFLDASAHHEHYNQSVLLEAPSQLDHALLVQLMAALHERHDALRLRVARGAGAWEAGYAVPAAHLAQDAVTSEALPDGAGAATRIAERCAAMQCSIDLASGPMLRALLLTSARPGAARLFLVAHHLVVDGVSWRILLADLALAFGQLAAGRPVALPAKTSSYQAWGAAVAAHAPRAAAQLPYWLGQLAQPVPALPCHRPHGAGAPRASTRTVRIELGAADTEALLKRCGQRYRTRIDELLLAAVSIGVRDWRGAGGLRLLLEGHGREELSDALDTSQTVGWFTTTYPVTLACDSQDTGAVICQVKEQLRAVPQKGFGYGVLRHIAGEPALADAERANPAQLVFNYLGQFDQSIDAAGPLRMAPEPTGDAIDPRRLRPCPLGLNGQVMAGQLGFVLDYSALEFEHADVERLAHLIRAGLLAVIAHCADAAPGPYTPSDFPLAHVSGAQLDAWQRRYRIGKLYPATSMQQGMLFHTLLDSSAYVTQTYPVMTGALDVQRFRAAWDAVTARYDILRTAFVGQGEQLQQLVCTSVELPWSEEDWRDAAPAEQAARLARLLEEDRSRGFDPEQAPLQRITLVRLGEERYQLLWTHHHMLLDGWCTPLVYRDLLQAYRRLLAGQAPFTAPAPSYDSYIAWLQRQDSDAARDYWRGYLSAIDGPTALRLPRPAAGAADGEQRIHFDAAETASLQRFARERRTTVNTMMQLAWGYLLQRYSGEQHVLFGTTVSGRPAEVRDVEEMVGLFINTVPVRVSFDTTRQVDALLAGLHDAFQASTAHGFLPLTEIARCSPAGGGTLFDSIVVFENYPLDAALGEGDQAGIALETLDSFIANGYGVTLNVNDGAALRIGCAYSGKVLDATMAAAVLDQLKRVLLAMAGGARDIGEICLLSPAQRDQMLVEWNGTARAYEDGRCVHAQFEQAAAEWPARTAVAHGGRTLSYAQLNAKANRLAHYLAEQGVGAGQRVGIHVERSPELLVAMLGVLKAGAAYVPFEPKNTRDRLGAIIRDAGIEWVLVQPGMADRLPPGGVDLLMLDDGTGSGWLDGYPEGNPSAHGLAPALHDSAYVIYTSGSTGTPKGVEIAHLGLMDYCAFASRRYYAGHLAGSRVVTSHGFDITVPSLYLPLLRGGTVELLDAGEELACLAARLADPDCAPALLRMTPMHVRGLLELLPAAAPVRGRHVFVVGGEAFTPGLARELQRRCPHSQLFNHYGPTETVVGCAMYDISANLDAIDRVLPIGRAMDNTRLYVLNAALQPCPAGVAGELHIGGAGVAKGYLNQPALTAAKFIADPFNPGERLYKTGDLVRMLAGGDIEFIGRADDQVKLRGYRIELGEVRAALQRLPQVRDAAVLADGEGERKRLLGYLVPAVPAVDEAAYVAAVQEALRQALPEYMVPSGFALLNHLPLTPNGKIDARSLLALGGLLGSGTVMAAPSGPTEIRLAGTWCELLGLEQVSTTASFFDVGGHSLLAMRLINAVQGGFGVAFSLKALLANPTIAAMASQIDASLARAGNSEGANDNENNVETEW